MNTLWETIITQPTQFGISDATDEGVLASNASGYLFWDDVHPTTQVQHLIEQFAVRGLIDYFSPSRGKGQPPAQVNSLNGLVHAGKP